MAGCRVLARSSGGQVRANSVIAKMNKPLTEVFSPVKSGDGTLGNFHPIDNVLSIAFTHQPDSAVTAAHCFEITILTEIVETFIKCAFEIPKLWAMSLILVSLSPQSPT